MLTRIALLLFGSGFCALVYQTAWLRMLRLIFGASTAASAAVLAIFMAGLGFGGLWLGRRADRHPSPLGFYAVLEGGIAVAAGLSPWLVGLIENLYIGLGGSDRLGLAGGSAVRLLLAALVLGVPTFLMGGTLPAVARAVESSADAGRRRVGLLYAVNTLGAVLGTLLTTFFALEVLGIRKTVWVAALLNLLVALAARRMALRATTESAGEPVARDDAAAGAKMVPLAAALVGFAFLLMELVWYRMLAPLLGGSSYTFGLILAVALLGIGFGGLLYSAGERQRRPTLLAFASTCALEALLIALPFALGDRLALLAALLRPFSSAGFAALVAGWTVLTALVVLPAALVAGYQFPLLIALLGSGRERVGREVGVTYAANTVGAIVGSIAGGFGLLPLLSAPGTWRLVVLLLLGLAVVSAVRGVATASWRAAAVPLAVGAVGLLLCLAPGPSAFWRHTPIGAGRFETSWQGPNEMRDSLHQRRRGIVWERDGVESSVALEGKYEYAFLVNGKADGSARSDSPTQVMGGLVGALLHPGPRRALVIGLGTGSTAGWLAQVPTMERVDVVELEPAIVDVARACSPVNQQALSNPKVHLAIGDGREVLLAGRGAYDIVFSEPSNPYRAGIASLFTADFYEAVRRRLRPGGMFLQWLQGYELDSQVVRTVYATLGSVFPAVESWEVNSGDLLLVATMEPVVHDLDRVRARAAAQPYLGALSWTWGVEGAEGFYTGYLASPAFGRAVKEAEGDWIDTDDRPLLEFGFARNLGRSGLFRTSDLRSLVESRGESRPQQVRGAPLDWTRVEELRSARSTFWRRVPSDPDPDMAPEARARVQARRYYASGELDYACSRWFSQPVEPLSSLDVLLVAECLASQGNPRARSYVPRLRQRSAVEAELVLALLESSSRRPGLATRHLLAATEALRSDPWP
ncbi:MAG TPA: fused MFS/spermidine synthase, partial [Thermoanaerobaculia bacterium]|nr:fused MFS/spermidine synthase [Thermoanaerobaculia bacterium]